MSGAARPVAATTQAAVHVRVEGLVRHFASGGAWAPGGARIVRAVDGVDLVIARGEALGLVGESGSGKSTLGRALVRLVEPTAGRVVIDGVDVTGLAPAALRRFRRRAQMIFQDPQASLNPRMAAGETVAEPLRIHDLVRGDEAIAVEVARIIARVGLGPETIARRPHELSAGQRQRVGLARALASRPDFLVADEPISSLDVSIQAQIVNLLAGLRREDRLTLLFISHDLEMVEHLCDRVAVMYLGRIVEEAPAARLRARARHPYTEALWSAAPAIASLTPRRPRILLEGEMPSPANPPPGCAFHPRCPLYVQKMHPERCRVESPVLDDHGPAAGAPAHRVACHFGAER